MYLLSWLISKNLVIGDNLRTADFIQKLTEKIFLIIIEEDPNNWLVKKEILKVFNLCLQNVRRNLRNETVTKLKDIYL